MSQESKTTLRNNQNTRSSGLVEIRNNHDDADGSKETKVTHIETDGHTICAHRRNKYTNWTKLKPSCLHLVCDRNLWRSVIFLVYPVSFAFSRHLSRWIFSAESTRGGGRDNTRRERKHLHFLSPRSTSSTLRRNKCR